MTTSTLFWLLIAVIVSIPILWWLITFRRSFEPIEGEEYQIGFFGRHIFTVKLGDPKVKWFQRLPYYILFAPFKVITFTYEWVQEMTYEEYLEKKAIAVTRKDYAVSIVWQPKYKDTELQANGIPKDKTVKILVSRKEKLHSLREIEGFTLATEFETADTYRGWRLFTLLFEIKDLSKIIKRFRHWQQPATLTFKHEYNAWSKTVNYETLRTTTMNKLSQNLGRSTAEPFLTEINEKTIEFGYIVNSIKAGEIYLAAETMDMIELQEEPKKAELRSKAAEFNAKTVTTNAQADADAEVIKAKGTATAIETIEKTKTKVIKERTKIAVDAAKDLSKLTVDQHKAKFGDSGISGIKGVYVEGQNGAASTVNTQDVLENILALRIEDSQQNQGGDE